MNSKERENEKKKKGKVKVRGSHWEREEECEEATNRL